MRFALRCWTWHWRQVTDRRSERGHRTRTRSLVTDRVDLLGDGRGALELQVELEGLVVREGLPAVRALELAVQLDPHVLERAVARHRLLADLQRLRHGGETGRRASVPGSASCAAGHDV